MRYTLVRHAAGGGWQPVGSIDIDGNAISFKTSDHVLRDSLQEVVSRPVTTLEGLRSSDGNEVGVRDRVVPPDDPRYPWAIMNELPGEYGFLELLKQGASTGTSRSRTA